MNKNKKTISELVKEKIEKKEVKPIPKWHFLLKHGFLWILLLILLTIGAVAVGVSIFEFADIDWDLQPRLGLGIGRFVMTILPYFWLIVLGLVGVLAYFNFMATPKGYKYPKYQIVIFGILLIILTGSALHYFGIARNIRERAEETSYLKELMQDHGKLWNKPENGLLMGEILSIDENDMTATVKGPNGSEWFVDISNIELPPNKRIESGQSLKILGEMTGKDSFIANEARPWRKGDPLRFGDKMKNGLMDGEGPKHEGTGPESGPPPKSNF